MLTYSFDKTGSDSLTNIYTNVLKMIYYPVNLHRITNYPPNALLPKISASAPLPLKMHMPS